MPSEKSINILKKIIWMLLPFFIIVTIVFLFFITAKGGNANFELLYVSIFIGIMVVKEMIDEHIPDNLKRKVNFIMSILIYVWLFIFINEIVSNIRR